MTYISRASLVGGVSSPLRSFAQVGGKALAIARGEGAYLFDTTGKRYLDFVLGFGSQVLGHTPAVVAKILKKNQGVQFGLNSNPEAELANFLVKTFPSIECVRFTTSGSEATFLAVRLAQTFTKKQKVIVFRRGYHGHALIGDSDLIAIPEFDLVALKKAVLKYKPAALLAEPVLGNAGCILPPASFWPQAVKLLRREKTLLIFDEVMTGFRVAFGGYQTLHKLKPDLTCLGKVIGGGLPLAAIGGSRQIMDQLRPVGEVVHAGTFAGHPLACSTGLATLQELKKKRNELEKTASWLERELSKIIPVRRAGSMFAFGLPKPRFKKLFWHLAEQGFLLPPSSSESFFLSTAHAKRDLEGFVEAVRGFFTPLGIS